MLLWGMEEVWCLARGVVRGLCLGFTNHVRTGGVFDVCLGCGGVCGEWVGLEPGSGWVV